MRKANIIFWLSTSVIFLLEGLMPTFTSQTEMAKEAIKHFGYPEYFGIMLTVFKVLGALALIIPQIPKRIKEWAYAGFAIDFIAAFVSIWAVDGLKTDLLFPIVAIIILIASYLSYHQINKNTL